MLDIAAIATVLGKATPILLDPNNISAFAQAGSVLFNARTMALQAETRQESMKASAEATRANHEHQLRMFYLQQEYQNQARWIDSKLRIEQQQIAQDVEAHKIRLLKSGERHYPPGMWIKTRLPNEPAPIIIIAENLESKNSPFKHEHSSIIAPLGRITERLKHYNTDFMGEGNALSIINTQEPFVSEGDARAFYLQELNCPTILIYAEFSGDSLKIKALIAGILDDQIKFTEGEGGQLSCTLGPRVIDLWKISYQDIEILKGLSEQKSDKPEQKGNKLGWLNTLETYTETMVGLYVQLLLDDYFKSAPPSVYQPQAARYLKDKEVEFRQIGHWETLEKSINGRTIAIKNYQALLQKRIIKNSILENSIPKSQLLGTYISFNTAKVIEKVDGTWALKDEKQNIFKPYFINSELNPNPKFVGGVARIINYNKEGNKKIGFIDDKGFLTVPFEYDDSDEASEGFVAICKNEKWGLVNLQGQVVLPFEYEDLNSPIDGLVPFKKVGKWGVVDVKGIVFFKNEFDKIEIINTQCVILKQGNNWFVSNIHGDIILKQKDVGFIKHLKDGFFVLNKGIGTYIYIQSTNKMFDIKCATTTNSTFTNLENGDFVLHKDYASGIIISLSENTISSYEFESLGILNKLSNLFNGHVPIKSKVVYDFLGNIKKSIILPPENRLFLKIRNCGQIGYVMSIVPLIQIMCGICTINFEKIIPNIYGDIRGFFNGLAAAQKGGKWGFINIINEPVIPFMYEDIRSFSDGVAPVKLNGKWGTINQQGEKIVDFLFKEIATYQGNRAFVKFSDHSNKYWGIIDNQGNILAE